MHDISARTHSERACAYEYASEHDDQHANAAGRLADALEEQALGLTYRMEAAERRVEGEQEHREELDGREVGRRRDVDAARAAGEEELRRRLERRRRRERAGLRHYRPGPGRSAALRPPAVTGDVSEYGFENEIAAIARVLDEHAATERGQLADMAGARYWGPGVSRDALRLAVVDGDVRPTARGTYAPADMAHDSR